MICEILPGSAAPTVENPNGRIIFVCMAKMRKKSELPQKACITCGRPFVWRKKWAKDWDAVRYCSDKCRMLRKSASP